MNPEYTPNLIHAALTILHNGLPDNDPVNHELLYRAKLYLTKLFVDNTPSV